MKRPDLHLQIAPCAVNRRESRLSRTVGTSEPLARVAEMGANRNPRISSAHSGLGGNNAAIYFGSNSARLLVRG